MAWGQDLGGFFRVLSIFSPEDNNISPTWAKAWIKSLAPKINVFFWIMLQNKILNLGNLQIGVLIWLIDVASTRWR